MAAVTLEAIWSSLAASEEKIIRRSWTHLISTIRFRGRRKTAGTYRRRGRRLVYARNTPIARWNRPQSCLLVADRLDTEQVRRGVQAFVLKKLLEPGYFRGLDKRYEPHYSGYEG